MGATAAISATACGTAIRFHLPGPSPSRRRTPSLTSVPPSPSKRLLRRSALLLLALPTLVPVLADAPCAAAFSIGICTSGLSSLTPFQLVVFASLLIFVCVFEAGPKEWLREQKKKSAKFVLAPIEASRQSLRTAYLLLTESGPQLVDMEEVRRLLNSAARDCDPQQRSSLVQFQSQTGVEVCTFRLILKNAASLLDNDDPVKLEAEAMLDDLIRSFSFVGTVLDNHDNIQLATNREKVKNALADTISALDKLDRGIKNCLGI